MQKAKGPGEADASSIGQDVIITRTLRTSAEGSCRLQSFLLAKYSVDVSVIIHNRPKLANLYFGRYKVGFRKGQKLRNKATFSSFLPVDDQCTWYESCPGEHETEILAIVGQSICRSVTLVARCFPIFWSAIHTHETYCDAAEKNDGNLLDPDIRRMSCARSRFFCHSPARPPRGIKDCPQLALVGISVREA